MFNEELDIFMMQINKYFNHLNHNPKSLMARIYGVFQVNMKGIVPINFILMANSKNVRLDSGLKEYDLKGSMVNRYVAHTGGKKQTLKDRNILQA